jgi:hypothetical protein
MSGADLEPTDHWTVIYRDALVRWIEGGVLLGAIGAVTEWIRGCELMGPPLEALLVDDGETCTVLIQGTEVEVEFLVVAYERLIIARSIDDT